MSQLEPHHKTVVVLEAQGLCAEFQAGSHWGVGGGGGEGWRVLEQAPCPERICHPGETVLHPVCFLSPHVALGFKLLMERGTGRAFHRGRPWFGF